MLSTVLEP